MLIVMFIILQTKGTYRSDLLDTSNNVLVIKHLYHYNNTKRIIPLNAGFKNNIENTFKPNTGQTWTILEPIAAYFGSLPNTRT